MQTMDGSGTDGFRERSAGLKVHERNTLKIVTQIVTCVFNKLCTSVEVMVGSVAILVSCRSCHEESKEEVYTQEDVDEVIAKHKCMIAKFYKKMAEYRRKD